MATIPPLSSDRLYRSCETNRSAFSTTADLAELTESIGQLRASEAAQFGFGMRHAGYNLYVMGPAGIGKRFLIHKLLEKRVAEQAKRSDWC